MLIKHIDRIRYDEIQSSEKIMSDQIREWENREDEMIERTKGLWLGIIETRKEINAIKQRRAAKVRRLYLQVLRGPCKTVFSSKTEKIWSP